MTSALKGPESENMLVTTVASTTHDRKCGRYTTVWKNFLQMPTVISFNRIANDTGTMILKISFAKAMTSVFTNTCRLSGRLKIN